MKGMESKTEQEDICNIKTEEVINLSTKSVVNGLKSTIFLNADIDFESVSADIHDVHVFPSTASTKGRVCITRVEHSALSMSH